MVSIKHIFLFMALAVEGYSKTLPPSFCEQDVIQHCLKNFEAKYANCEADDFVCQCDHVLTTGAMCYSPCPQEDMTSFIKTYSDGKCAQYDPVLKTLAPINDGSLGLKAHQLAQAPKLVEAPTHSTTTHATKSTKLSSTKTHSNRTQTTHSNSNLTLSTVAAPAKDGKLSKFMNVLSPIRHDKDKREINLENVEILSANRTGTLTTSHTAEDAMTLTADPPVTATKTIPVDDYRSQLEQRRYKENLARIRRERKRSSELAAERTASTITSGIPAAFATGSNDQYAEQQQRLDEENRVIGEKVIESRTKSEVSHGTIHKAKENGAVALKSSSVAIATAVIVMLFSGHALL